MKKREIRLVLLASLLLTFIWSFGQVAQAEETNVVDSNKETITFSLVNGQDLPDDSTNSGNSTKPLGGNSSSGLFPHTGEQQNMLVLIVGLIIVAICIVFFQQKRKSKKQKGRL